MTIQATNDTNAEMTRLLQDDVHKYLEASLNGNTSAAQDCEQKLKRDIKLFHDIFDIQDCSSKSHASPGQDDPGSTDTGFVDGANPAPSYLRPAQTFADNPSAELPGGPAKVNGASGLSTSTINPDNLPDTLNTAGNPVLEQSKQYLEQAAAATGINVNILAAQTMRENSGKCDQYATNNIDGTHDIGAMQISQERWDRDVCPHLSQSDKDKIKQQTGKDASQLKMNQYPDNIIGGAFHDLLYIRQFNGDVHHALTFYQSGDIPSVIAQAPTYAQDVLDGAKQIASGQQYTHFG